MGCKTTNRSSTNTLRMSETRPVAKTREGIGLGRIVSHEQRDGAISFLGNIGLPLPRRAVCKMLLVFTTFQREKERINCSL
jgi:hypothetical protein